jgi:hypothetical protein
VLPKNLRIPLEIEGVNYPGGARNNLVFSDFSERQEQEM